MLLNFKFDAGLFIVLHGVFSGKEIMYGSTPLLSQKESLPNFIDHGKDRMKKGEVTYDTRRLAHPRKRLIVHYNRLKPFLQA